jgi:hypothetical protein
LLFIHSFVLFFPLDCLLNVHENNCKDQVVSCLNFKTMPKQLSLSGSSKASLDLIAFQQQQQQNQLQIPSNQQQQDENNGSFFLNKSNNNSYSSRPRSMDITKYFQVKLYLSSQIQRNSCFIIFFKYFILNLKAHLSKSTSNMYRYVFIYSLF